MSKYIKSFDTTAEMQQYMQTATGKTYYLLKDNSGSEGIGTTLASGKKIISYYKPQHDYLTFTAVDAGATVMYNTGITNTTAEYSLDGGNTWTNAVGVTVTLTNVGDSVKYRGVISGVQGGATYYHPVFSFKKNTRISASGSVMSMYNNNPDDTVIAYEKAFYCLFSGDAGNNALITSPEFPATTLAKRCYEKCFYNCTGLTVAPELPALEVQEASYGAMFKRCTSLTVAPELPATTLGKYAYSTVSHSSNDDGGMFEGCTSLTTAPELPATNLTEGCYYNLFYNCTSLTTAPELPATTLATNSYKYMFYLCSSLTSVTHHITDWRALDASSWLYRVAATGTVYCPADSTIPANNVSGIPTGWTRIDL